MTFPPSNTSSLPGPSLPGPATSSLSLLSSPPENDKPSTLRRDLPDPCSPPDLRDTCLDPPLVAVGAALGSSVNFEEFVFNSDVKSATGGGDDVIFAYAYGSLSSSSSGVLIFLDFFFSSTGEVTRLTTLLSSLIIKRSRSFEQTLSNCSDIFPLVMKCKNLMLLR